MLTHSFYNEIILSLYIFHLHLGRKYFRPKMLTDSLGNKQILSLNVSITIGG